jgi:hypothetical protein
MGSSMTELQTSQQHRANSVARIDSAILARHNDLPPSERATGFELLSGQSRIPIFTPFTATQTRRSDTPTRVRDSVRKGPAPQFRPVVPRRPQPVRPGWTHAGSGARSIAPDRRRMADEASAAAASHATSSASGPARPRRKAHATPGGAATPPREPTPRFRIVEVPSSARVPP